ncbi:MAG TPA: response regulator [Kofleriaceae bacterium]
MKRILLMDDSPVFLAVTGSALQKAGYEVITASDLGDLERVRAAGPSDLVLMDVQMPEAFGDDVAMTLRHAYGVATPIYLLSSLPDIDLADRVRWAGIDGFISKNQGLDAIVSAVRGILQPEAATAG